jgi:hypothetical protein
MADFATNAPELARFQVKFANWTDYGIVINGPKCLMDAKNFRRAAKLILADARSDEDRAIGEWLNTLAGQFQNAAMGADPQAEAEPYDKPPEAAEPEKAKAKPSRKPARGKPSGRRNSKRKSRR